MTDGRLGLFLCEVRKVFNTAKAEKITTADIEQILNFIRKYDKDNKQLLAELTAIKTLFECVK